MSSSLSNLEFGRAKDPTVVCEILTEAVEWMIASPPYRALWEADEVALETITQQLDHYHLGWLDNEPIITFQLTDHDPTFWPDVDDAAIYIHRIAVARKYAAQKTGRSVLPELFAYAADQALARDTKILRLDCDKTRPALGELYVRCGFQYHSDIELRNYHGARYQKVLA